MSYGSYYQSSPNYWRNPVPYTSSDIGAPVPGWGTSIQVAGPARVGVGQTERIAEVTGPPSKPPPPPPDPTQVAGLPWWAWPAAAAIVMGGIGYFGTKKGWF